METDPGPPEAPKEDGDVFALIEHLSPLGAVVDVELDVQAAIRQPSATASTAANGRPGATRGLMHAARQPNRGVNVG